MSFTSIVTPLVNAKLVFVCHPKVAECGERFEIRHTTGHPQHEVYFFVLFCSRVGNPASHRYVDAKGMRIRRALSVILEYEFFISIQNSVRIF